MWIWCEGANLGLRLWVPNGAHDVSWCHDITLRRRTAVMLLRPCGALEVTSEISQDLQCNFQFLPEVASEAWKGLGCDLCGSGQPWKWCPRPCETSDMTSGFVPEVGSETLQDFGCHHRGHVRPSMPLPVQNWNLHRSPAVCGLSALKILWVSRHPGPPRVGASGLRSEIWALCCWTFSLLAIAKFLNSKDIEAAERNKQKKDSNWKTNQKVEWTNWTIQEWYAFDELILSYLKYGCTKYAEWNLLKSFKMAQDALQPLEIFVLK